jgi:APA family basic amino acid/polyamine antiporter
MTFGRYAVELTGIPLEERTVAVLTLLLLAAINCLGVKSGSLVQGALMVLKIGVLLSLIVLGLLLHRPPAPTPPAGRDGLLAFGAAMVPVLFAYGGWQAANFVAPRCASPAATFPGPSWPESSGWWSSTWARTGSTCAGSAGGARGDRNARLDLDARDPRPRRRHLHRPGYRGLHPRLPQPLALTMPRVYFAMASDGVFFSSVARVSERTHAPVVAIVLQAGLSIGVALSGRYEQILGYVVSADWVFFGLSAASLFVLRRRAVAGSGSGSGCPVIRSPPVRSCSSRAWWFSPPPALPAERFAGLGLVLAGSRLRAVDAEGGPLRGADLVR